MRKLFSLITLLPVAVLAAGPVEVEISTGPQDGTYHTMMVEAREVCQDPRFSLVLETSDGSVTNVDRLVANKTNGADVQADVAFLRGQTSNLTNFVQLMTLHPEEVHLIAHAVSRKEGGFSIGKFAFNQSDVVLDSILSLNGRRVAAAGGSIETANVIKLLTGINFEIVPVSPPEKGSVNTELVSRLNAGEVDAILAVGGQPLLWVNNLGPKYKLLAIPADVASKLSKVYKPATVSYSKLAVRTVDTVATNAMLLVRNYKTPETRDALDRFRSCVISHLDFLRETKGKHPKWQEVPDTQLTDPGVRAKWAWFESSPAPTPAKK